MDGGDESGDGLADYDEYALDGVGVFGGEGGCDAGVSELDLIIHEASSSFFGPFTHSFLGDLIHELHFFGNSHPDVVLNLVHPSLEGFFFLFLFFFLLHHIADVGGPDDGHSHVCVSKSAHIVGAISCVHDSPLLFFEVFDYHFFVVR